MPMRLPTDVRACLERLEAGAKAYPSDHAMLVRAVEMHLVQMHRDDHGVIVFTVTEHGRDVLRRGWM